MFVCLWMINWPTLLLKDAAFGRNTNRQFELLNLKACKIWYMLDGSYVAVKTVGSKPYSKKIFFIFAQDCTANNLVVGLHGVPTSSVSYQSKNIFYL